MKRARDTLTRTLSRTIFMFNLFVKWEYTSANNNQQSHIWNRHRATTIITQREPASRANHGRTLIPKRWLELRRELGLHVCWKMIDYFLAYKAKMIYIVLCQFFFRWIVLNTKQRAFHWDCGFCFSSFLRNFILNNDVKYVSTWIKRSTQSNSSKKMWISLTWNEIEILRNLYRTMKMKLHMIWIKIRFLNESKHDFHSSWSSMKKIDE